MATTKYKGLVVEINGNTTKLKKAMGELRAEGTVLRSHLSSLGKLIEFNPGSTELLAQKQRLLGTALAQNAEQLALMKAAEAQFHASVGPHTEAEIAEYRNLQRRMTQVQLEYQRLKQQAIEFGSAASLSSLAAKGKLQSLQNGLATVSNKFLAVGVTAGVVGALSLKAAVSFEQAFADVRKTIIATDEEYEKLAYDIRQMALVKPITPEDLAYIESLGGQLNVATQHLTKFTDTIADLDIATDMNLEDASLQLARFMNIAGMGQQDVDRLGATIVDLGNNSATTESQIMLMAMRIVGSASNIGMSAPNVLALATALSSVGIQAEMGGNAISTIMNRIDKDVALNSQTLSTWASTAGMSAQEFSSLWQNDVTSALMAVVKGMGTFRDEGNNLNLLLKDMGINYMRQVDTMQRLSRTGDLLSEAFTRSDTAWEQNVALVREANQRYETAESKMQMMKNALNETGIVIGNEILPYFKELVVGVTDAIRSFADMDEGTKQFVITVAGAMTVCSLGVKAVEMLAGGGAKLIGTLNSLKTAMAFYIAEQTVGTGATTANTAATAANTAAEEANVVARRANVAATAQEATTQNVVTVAKNAATIASGKLAAALGLESALAGGLVGVLGIAAVVALTAFAAAVADAADDTDELTEASKQSKQSMTEAQIAYEAAKIKNGELSNEALAAKGALDEETAAFEASKETIGEFCDRVNDTVEAHDGLMDTISETSSEANSTAASVLNLANQYAELVGMQGRDEVSKARLSAITQTLNGQIEGLGLVYDEATDSVNMSADAVQALADKESKRLRAEASMENLNGLYAEAAQLSIDLQDAQSELEAETQKNVEAYGKLGSVQVFTSQAQADLEDSVESLSDAYEENQRKIQEQERVLADMQSKELALKYATDELSAGTATAAEAAEKMSERFGTNITEADVLAEKEARLAEQMQQNAVDVSELVEELEKLEAENGYLVTAIAESGLSVEEFAQKMVDAGVKADDLAKGVEETAQKTSDAFSKIEYESDISLNSMIETLEHNIQATASWSENMATLYSQAGSASERNFLNYIGSLGVEYAPIVSELVNDTSGKLAYLADLYANAGSTGSMAFLMSIGMLPGETGEITDEMVTEAQESFDQLVQDSGAAGADASAAMESGIRSGGSPQGAMAGLVEGVDYEAGQLPGKVQDSTSGTGSEIADGIMSQSGAAAGAADSVSKLVADHLSSASTDAWWAGSNMTGVSFRDGIDSGRGAAVASADVASKHVADHLSSANGDAWWAGYNMMMGMKRGIEDGRSLVVNAARNSVADAMSAAMAEAEINSPSRKWRRVIGWGLMEGGAVGIKDKAILMAEAAVDAVRSSSRAAEEAMAYADMQRRVDNAWSVPLYAASMMTAPQVVYVSQQGQQHPDAPVQARGSVYQNFEIHADNPEEVAALVAVRERRSYGG